MIRLKTKQDSAQDKRNWGTAKSMTKGEGWNMITRNEKSEDLPNASTAFDNKKITSDRKKFNFGIKVEHLKFF